jgi:hypothetical protein
MREPVTNNAAKAEPSFLAALIPAATSSSRPRVERGHLGHGPERRGLSGAAWRNTPLAVRPTVDTRCPGSGCMFLV